MILILKGMLLGIANIIPGVSGGTIALILGLYSRIIETLNKIDINTIKSVINLILFKKDAFSEFKAEMKRIELTFLLLLGFGAIVAIASTSKLMVWLLKEQHEPTYAFFFGLILFSILIPLRFLKRKSWKEFLALFLAAIFTIGLSFGVNDQEKIDSVIEKTKIKQEKLLKANSLNKKTSIISLEVPPISKLIFFFFAASIAISAMILPGISGSFIMLLFGVYFEILEAINNREIVIILVFAAGCGLGLLSFVRLLDYILKKWYNQTIAFLIGLMIGSLWALWPFKNSVIAANQTIYLGNTIPSIFAKTEIISALAFIIASAIILVFYKIDSANESSKTLK